ncbi:hypothetical protein GCM10027515_11020 [Schumannella luteola]|uniref:Uncharacterized protein n=1 Tax=Schumannella luteola TaxID=472059 RepID=A0A852Y8J7_9MICO|nr:hypothetical protein [Schumannella luteola]NYG97551.1 hypothetical protein [Schumannella luteola]TPX01597.1 hypothetical protein FJ656_26870 [Schumannella luteola]
MTWQFGAHPDDAARAAAAAPAGQDDDPPVGIPGRPPLRRPALVLRPRADTRDAVILELLPLLAPVLAIVATQAMVPWSIPLLLACIAVTCVAQFVIASRDAALLRVRGFVGTAPSALALVSPILYLALRGRVCSQHDRTAYAPVPWAIASTVVAVLLLIGTAWFESSVDASIGGMLTGLF